MDSYRTAICDWFERDIVEKFADDDMEFHIGDRRGFAGSIAAYEDIFGVGGMYGDSKAHEDTKIRVLLGIYRYVNKYCPGINRLSIVTGQPVINHKSKEKKRIIEMLQGEHTFTVNGEQQRFYIEDVGVAPEGSGAFWAAPQQGEIRIIDAGSGTINCATIIDKRHINTGSTTFNFGVETVGKAGILDIARAIIRATTQMKWKPSDSVFVCGGIAVELLPFIAEHYPATQTISPVLHREDGGVEILEPTYANAVGFYEIARLTYGKRRKQTHI